MDDVVVRCIRVDPCSARHPDLVARDLTATRSNRLWVIDLTYVPTWAGVAYVCFIVDAFSRVIVGWRVASNMPAIGSCRPSPASCRLRAGDVLYRYGGEEFLCVFPEQSLDSGTVAVERMRAGLEAQAIPHLGSPLGVLTLSAGLAVLDLSGTGSADDVLRAADDCLYRAKGLGRNRIECPLPPEDIGEQAAT